ncbi:MAG: 30S ribosomal protein S18 [Anaerolineae bacterium]|nr:30S ribosomal protein S18 [Anaerolineae bacterium]
MSDDREYQDYDSDDESRSGGGRSSHSGSRSYRPRRHSFRSKKKITGCSQRCVGRQGTPISYKQVRFLENYVTPHGKIRPRRQTSSCAKHQRALAQAIKRARHMALLPFAPGHESTSGR